MELGLATFADLAAGLSPEQRMRNLIEEAVLADQLGLDVFAIGEHHRPDFLISSPAVALAAIAARTERIRLSSAVTVLSSDDPVCVFQQFAELDLISDGRAEIMAGRGSFTESFPLFGYDLADYDDLFEEKLGLLLKIRESERVTWRGAHRASIDDLPVFPRPVQDPLPVWIAVGGHPESVVRAGRLGLPLALAIIGGEPRRFVPLVDLYRQAGRRPGHDPAKLRVSINSHGLIGDDSKRAADDAYAAYSYVMAKIGRERGWPPPSREQFEAERGPLGANLVGTPDEVAAKILYEHELFGLDRFLIQMSVGTLPHDKVLHAIELFGTKVAPIVRREIERRTEAIPMPAGTPA